MHTYRGNWFNDLITTYLLLKGKAYEKSGKTINSKGETFTVDAPLSQIPLFVKGGSIIPMCPENQYVDESQDPTEIRVYAGADGEFTLYEDEGDNYNYVKGEFSNIPFTYNEESKTLTTECLKAARLISFLYSPGMVSEDMFHQITSLRQW